MYALPPAEEMLQKRSRVDSSWSFHLESLMGGLCYLIERALGPHAAPSRVFPLNLPVTETRWSIGPRNFSKRSKPLQPELVDPPIRQIFG